MFNQKLAIVILLIFSSLNSFAQSNEPINTIVTAVPFITISSNMNLGMGNLNVVASPYNTQGSAMENPARMFQSQLNVSTSHTPWLRGIGIRDVWMSDVNGHYVINERHAVGAYCRRFSLGEIQFVDPGGNVLGSSTSMEYSAGLAYSYRLTQNFSIGINANYIYSRLANFNNTLINPVQSFSVGLGVLYQKNVDFDFGKLYYSIGTMISDIGPKVSYTSSSVGEVIPTNAAIGGMIGIRDFVPKLDVYIGYQMDKLLVPTPNTIDENVNGILDHKELTLIQGIVLSFNDAPNGNKEEWREISHSFGIEAMYNFNTKMRAGIRLGGFHEHYTKGNRKYVNASASFGYAGFYANLGYFFPKRNRSYPFDNMVSMNIGYQMGI